MLEAVGKYVMVELVKPPETSAGGIIMPDTLNNKTLHGVVMSVGLSHRDRGLVACDTPVDLKAGDIVFFNQHASNFHRMRVDDKEVAFLPPEEIFAVDRKNRTPHEKSAAGEQVDETRNVEAVIK